MGGIRVVLADDHPVVRSGIQSLLKGNEDIVVVGEAGNGTEALRLTRELTPDVLILDMDLPDIPGTEVARQLAAESLPIQVLGLSAYDDEEYIEEMLEAGAGGYLIKDEAPGQIVEAVRGLAQGEGGFFSRRVTAKLVQQRRRRLSPQGEQSLCGLTGREREVVSLLVEGCDDKEIADELFISEGTLRNYVTSIYEKLGVRKRVKIVAWAREHGFDAR